MTERLYYTDCYLRGFTARVVRLRDGLAVWLDRTAFYPTPAASPSIPARSPARQWWTSPMRRAHCSPACLAARRRSRPRLRHRLAPALRPHAAALRPAPALGRFRRALLTENRQLPHGRGELHHRSGRRQPSIPAPPREAEHRANASCSKTGRRHRVQRRRQAQRSAQALGARRHLAHRLHPGLDRSACGGTHVRSTGEIGAVLIRKLEKVRRRCAWNSSVATGRPPRARRLRRSPEPRRSSRASRRSPAAGRPTGDSAHRKRRAANWNWIWRLPGPGDLPGHCPGRRRFRRARARAGTWRPGKSARHRAEFHGAAQSHVSGRAGRSASVLLAVSADAGIDAGKALKAALAEAGGRGEAPSHGARQRTRRGIARSGARKTVMESSSRGSAYVGAGHARPLEFLHFRARGEMMRFVSGHGFSRAAESL